jgi:hypothetical protein
MPKSPFPVPSGVQQMRYCSGSVCTTDWFLDNYNPPPDLAELAAPIPCVAFSSAFNWVYSSGGCQVAKVNKVNENIGAPPPVIRGGQEYIGALP